MNYYEIIVTILSVIIGGIITYFVQTIFANKNRLREKKLEVYLEFLESASKIHSWDNMNEYFEIVRKMYLVANQKVLNTLLDNHYIPKKGVDFKEPKGQNEPLKRVIIAMRQDLGFSFKDYKKLQMINYYVKRSNYQRSLNNELSDELKT